MRVWMTEEDRAEARRILGAETEYSHLLAVSSRSSLPERESGFYPLPIPDHTDLLECDYVNERPDSIECQSPVISFGFTRSSIDGHCQVMSVDLQPPAGNEVQVTLTPVGEGDLVVTLNRQPVCLVLLGGGTIPVDFDGPQVMCIGPGAFDRTARTPFVSKLSVAFDDSLVDAQAISSLVNLVSLDLVGCDSLIDVDGLASLTGLELLNLSDSRSLSSVNGLANLTGLTSLDLRNCEALEGIEPLSELIRLTSLELSGCKALSSVDSLGSLSRITSLNLFDCESLTRVDSLGKLTGLTRLVLASCSSLTSLDGLGTLTNLRSLDLTGCSSLTNVNALVSLTGLRHLDLRWCTSFESLDPLGNLVNLESLDVSNCTSLSNVHALSSLTRLEDLVLSGDIAVVMLGRLSNPTGLKTLVLRSCVPLENVDALEGFSNLTYLALSDCKSLRDLSGLSNLSRLGRLSVRDCGSLTHVQGLANLQDLLEVSILRCPSISDLDSLSTCRNLRYLSFDVDVPAAAAILAATAVLRGDASQVAEHIRGCHGQRPRWYPTDWLDLFPRSKSPSLYATRLARAIALGGSDEWALEALASLITRARRLADVNSSAWHAILTTSLATGDPHLRPLFQAAVADLDLRADAGLITEPWLTVLSQTPTSAHAWALETATALLAPLEDDPLGRELAPAICVLYARLGRNDLVRTWIERGTDQRAPVWRDRIHLALLGWQLERGETVRAREHLRQIETVGVRDQAHEALARALAAVAPAEAGEELAAVAEVARRAVLAAGLAEVPEFTSSLENTYRLILELQHEPDTLAGLLATMTERHPESPLVAEMARQLGDRERATDLAEAAAEILASETITDMVGKRKLQRMSELLTDERTLRRILIHGVVAALREYGALDEDDVSEVLSGFSAERIL